MLKTLLLGMGNPILSDDAVGVRLAGEFRRRLESEGGCPGLTIQEECSLGGLNLLDLVPGFDRLIVLDSIRTGVGSPGSWYAFTAESLGETLHLDSIHDLNFATAMELGRRLGHKIPPDREIHVLAVEIDDDRTFSETMTPALEQAYPVLVEEIWAELRRLLRLAESAETTAWGGAQALDPAAAASG